MKLDRLKPRPWCSSLDVVIQLNTLDHKSEFTYPDIYVIMQLLSRYCYDLLNDVDS